MPTLNTSSVGLAFGTATVAGVGDRNRLAFSSTWSAGDHWTLLLTDSLTGIVTQVGYGAVSGLVPTFAFTYKKKIYVLAGAATYFSALNLPRIFNDPNAAGNGFIDMSNEAGTPETLVAVAPYQGKAVFFARNTIQIWSVDPDPALYSQVQVLANIGTMAKLSVKPVGDLDIYFLSDSGFRSVRVRDASNNAIPVDIGTPIDSLIQDVLAATSESNKALACAVVDPETKRYWCLLSGTMYVFSNFRESGVSAWSTYTPTFYEVGATISPTLVAGNTNYTYTGLSVGTTYRWSKGPVDLGLTNGTLTVSNSDSFVAVSTTAVVSRSALTGGLGILAPVVRTTFAPEKFEVLNGRIYVRAGDDLFLYGGSDNTIVDEVEASWATFYMDAKNASQRKEVYGVDAAFSGAWTVKFGMDPGSDSVKTVYENNAATYWQGRIPVSDRGYFFKLTGTTKGSRAAQFDAFTVLYRGLDAT